jgi:Rho-binding antiterminator
MISCELYDYFEIACMQRLKLRLQMLDGSELEGTALDTGRTSDKQEALILLIDEDTKYIALEDISTLTSLTENPHFHELVIRPK